MNLTNQRLQQKEINKKIVRILLNYKNDIRIQWNFNGMLMPKVFRRHVFISLSCKQNQILKAHNIFQSCYQYFKCGDLYAFAIPNTKMFSWFQKTKVDYFRSSFCPQQLQDEDFGQYFTKKQLLSLCKFRQPCFVVLFFDPECSLNSIQKFIAELRQKQKFSCFVFIVSSQYEHNSIDYSNGIFQVSEKQSRNLDIERLYKFYNERLACLHAKILIQSKTGDVFVEQGIWKPHSFFHFSRTIYYPLAKQFVDIIQTYKLYSQKIKQWKFIIKLEYKLLNGLIFCDCKQIVVSLEEDIQKYVTYNQQLYKNKKFSLYLGTQLESNPFLKIVSIQSGIGFNNI